MDRRSFGLRSMVLGLSVLVACRSDNLEPRVPNSPTTPRPHFLITHYDTLYPIADTWVRSAPKWQTQTGSDSLRTKDIAGNTDTNRTVIRFDQAAIAAQVGAKTLVSAQLQMTIKASGSYSAGNDVAVHRMTMGWVEDSATWKCGSDLDITNTYHDCTATAWAMSGSGTVPYVTTATTQLHLTSGQTGVSQFDVTADVEAFLDGTTNNGWLLKLVDESRDQRVSYWSREAATGKPRLILTLTEPDTTPPPSADSVLYPVADNWVRSAPKWQNQGGSDSLRAKDTEGNTDTNRTVLRFDQAAIASYVAGRPLTHATLEVTLKSVGNYTGGNDVAVHRLTMPWTEDGMTWKCGEDLDLTNTYHDCTTTAWAMSGSGTVPFVSTSTAQAHLTGGQTGVVQFDVTADVQAFLSGTTNQGWLLKLVDESRTQRVSFWAREAATGTPRLILTVNQGWAQLNGTYPVFDTSKTVVVPGDTFKVYRTDIRVRFNDGVSDAAKTAFFVRHNLSVLGVDPTNAFYVRSPDPGSTSTNYYNLVDSLNAEPEIKWSLPIYRGGIPSAVAARYPTDGSGFQRADYLGTSASTWAIRAIRAPLAWGCETGQYGSSPVPVGLLEYKHDTSHPEFAASAPTLWQMPDSVLRQAGQVSSDSANIFLAHATYTTGLLTASGDDNRGIAGVMWKTKLFQYSSLSPSNYRLDLATGFYMIANQVLADGVRVLSLSAPGEFPGTDRRDIQEDNIKDIAGDFRDLLYKNSSLLIVAAAGNDRFRGTPEEYARSDRPNALVAALLLLTLEEAYRDRIVIVAGTEQGNKFWDHGVNANEGSNFFTGATDLAAPAKDITVLDRRTGSGSPTTVQTGTSLSAPLVAGVAAQLIAMYPALTPAEVKQYLVQGAQTRFDPISATSTQATSISDAPSGVTLYQLDAYNSLLLLAANKQTPICGFSISLDLDNDQIVLHRNGGTSERIDFGSDVVAAGGLSVAQGGRLISLGNVWANSYGLREFRFDAGSWTAGPTISAYDAQIGGYVMNRRYLERDTAYQYLGTGGVDGDFGTLVELLTVRRDDGTHTDGLYVLPSTPGYHQNLPHIELQDLSPSGDWIVAFSSATSTSDNCVKLNRSFLRDVRSTTAVVVAQESYNGCSQPPVSMLRVSAAWKQGPSHVVVGHYRSDGSTGLRKLVVDETNGSLTSGNEEIYVAREIRPYAYSVDATTVITMERLSDGSCYEVRRLGESPFTLLSQVPTSNTWSNWGCADPSVVSNSIARLDTPTLFVPSSATVLQPSLLTARLIQLLGATRPDPDFMRQWLRAHGGPSRRVRFN